VILYELLVGALPFSCGRMLGEGTQPCAQIRTPGAHASQHEAQVSGRISEDSQPSARSSPCLRAESAWLNSMDHYEGAREESDRRYGSLPN